MRSNGPEMPDQVTQPPLQLGPARQYLGLIHQDHQGIGDRAAFDDEGAVHVDFAQREFGIEKNAAFRLSGQESHRNRLSGAVAAAKPGATGGRKVHRAAANELLQKITQQTVHRNHQTERSRRANAPAVTPELAGNNRSSCLNTIIIAKVPLRYCIVDTADIPKHRVHTVAS